MSQKDRILAALRIWCSPAEAFKEAGTLKLATRVGELRLAGYDIEDKWDDPVQKNYKLYRLKPVEKFVAKTEWRPINSWHPDMEVN